MSVGDIDKATRAMRETLVKGQLSMAFTAKYLGKFLADGQLNREDLFAFYSGEDIRKQFAAMDVTGLLKPQTSLPRGN